MKGIMKKILPIALCAAMVLGIGLNINQVPTQASDTRQLVADNSTYNMWNTVNFSESTKNVGRIWTDKSVFSDQLTFTVGPLDGQSITKTEGSDFLVALSALSSTSTATTTQSAPLDIMMIFDESGSMEYVPGSNSDSTRKRVNNADISTDEMYEVQVNNIYQDVYYNGTEWGYWNRNTWTSVTPNNFYTRNSRMAALKNAAMSFIHTMDALNESITDEAKKHRIAITTFAANGNVDNNLTTQMDTLLKTVSGLEGSGATNAGDGFVKAKNHLDSYTRQGAKKVVLFFTDGVPTTSSDFSSSVAQNAINQAIALKNEGALIYSIAMYNGADPEAAIGTSTTEQKINRFLHAVSSNYPNVTGSTWNSYNLGTRAENSNYYKAVSSADELLTIFNDIFSEISSEAQSPTTTDANAPQSSGYIEFKDALGSYMTLKDVNAVVFLNQIFSKKSVTSTATEDQYIFEGTVTDVNPVHKGDYELSSLQITVTKGSDPATGDVVTVKIPAALLPLRYYDIKADHTLDIVDSFPIRILYSVGLKDGIGKAVESGDTAGIAGLDDYIKANTDEATGRVKFFSNNWSGDPEKGSTTATFTPATTNSFYYFTEDTPLYMDEACTIPLTDRNTDQTMLYYKFQYYENIVSGETAQLYETIGVSYNKDSANLDSILGGDSATGYYAKAGVPKFSLANAPKLRLAKPGANENGAVGTAQANVTATAQYALYPTWSSGGIQNYLGNNGIISYLATGNLETRMYITADEGLTAPKETFTLDVVLSNDSSDVTLEGTYNTRVVDTEGNVIDGTIDIDANGKGIMSLTADQYSSYAIRIIGIPGGTTYTITQPEETIPSGFKQIAQNNTTGSIMVAETAYARVDNRYSVAPYQLDASFPIRKVVVDGEGNVVDDWTLKDNWKFTFDVFNASGRTDVPMPASSQVVIDNTSENHTTSFGFSGMEITKPGEYIYGITENTPESTADRVTGINYSHAIYQIVVNATDNGDGTMKVTSELLQILNDAGAAVAVESQKVQEAVFTNTYTLDYVDAGPSFRKIFNDLSGERSLKDQEFAFRITPYGSNAASTPAFTPDTVYNTASGLIDFGTVRFEQEHVGREYQYKIEEIVPETPEAAMTYSDVYYIVTITVFEKINEETGRPAVAINGSHRKYIKDVTPEGQGQVVDRSELIFENTYDPAPVENVQIKVQKTLEGRSWNENETYEFTLNGYGGTATPENNTVTVDSSGSAYFPGITYDKAGTYNYLVTENAPANDTDGISYDRHIAGVVVTVTDKDEQGNHTGAFTATVGYYNEAALNDRDRMVKDASAFTNTYKAAETTMTPSAILVGKKLVGRDWGVTDRFGFTVIPDNLARAEFPVPSNSELGIGYFANDELHAYDDQIHMVYTTAGTYDYYIVENPTTIPGITADNSAYRFRVVVEDDLNGNMVITSQTFAKAALPEGWKLSASQATNLASLKQLTYTDVVFGENETPHAAFVNTYEAADVTLEGLTAIRGRKTLTGRDANADETFTFTLTPQADYPSVTIAEGADTASVSGLTDGFTAAFNFGSITFTETGTYKFDIKETVPAAPVPYTNYDAHTCTVTVVVTDDHASGSLKAAVTYDDGASKARNYAEFYNIYFDPNEAKDVTASSGADNGGNINPGDVLTYSIDWVNTAVDANNEAAPATITIVDKIPDGTTFQIGSISEGGIYDPDTNEITWTIEAMPADKGTVSFSVTVNNHLESGSNITNEGSIKIGDNDAIVTNKTENYVPGKSAKKGETPVVSGSEIQVGDVLTYTITYKNDTEAVSDVEITDTLPATLTYLTGTASDGGIYDAESHTLTWNLAGVPAGQTGAVSFQVRVNEDARTIVTANEATIKVGGDVVKTNVVTYDKTKTGTLTISKNVVLADGVTLPSGVSIPDKEFTFRGTLTSGGEALVKNYTYEKYDYSGNLITSATMKSGQTMTLKAGESLKVLELPKGSSYVIEEINLPGGFVQTAPAEAGSAVAASGTIGEGNSNADFTNTYAPVTLSGAENLKVEKAVVQNNVEMATWPEGASFIFKLTRLDGSNAPLPVKNQITLNDDLRADVFGDILFMEEGTYIYNIAETRESFLGINYSDAKYRITVTVSNVNGVLTPVSKMEKIYDDKGAELTAAPQLVNVARFENEYNFQTVAWRPEVTKYYTNSANPADRLTEGKFAFKLESVPSASTGTFPSGLAGTAYNDGNGAVRFGNVVFEEEHVGNTYVYKITEVYNAQIHDDTVYFVKVEVGSQTGANNSSIVTVTETYYKGTEDGTFETATRLTNGETAEFVNDYTPEPVTTTIDVQKTLSGRSEGWRDDDSYVFTLSAVSTGVPAASSTSLTINKETPYVGESKETKAAAIGTIEFNQVGTYVYAVREIPKGIDANGFKYDRHTSYVTIEVTDNQATRKLEAKVTYDNSSSNNSTADKNNSTIAAFTNIYTVSGQAAVTFEGVKTLSVVENSIVEMNAGDFTFELYGSTGPDAEGKWTAGNLLDQTTNAKDGSFSFTRTYYPNDIATGTFYYVVKEAKAGQTENGMEYSGIEYGIQVDVTDNGLGGIHAAAKVVSTAANQEIADGTMSFTNMYRIKTGTEVNINGKKYLHGKALAANEFTFELYEANGNFRVLSSQPLYSTTNDADGNFGFILTYSAQDPQIGNHYYVLREKAENEDGMIYSTAEYRIYVQNIDNGNGILETIVTVLDKGNNIVYNFKSKATAYSYDFTNFFYNKDEAKTVTGEDNRSADGGLVKAGETLTYEVKWMNTATDAYGNAIAADVIITDIIPANTTYVEPETVTDGRVYENGALTWTIQDAEPGASGTVSFQVKVNDNLQNGADIKNQANIRIGNNNPIVTNETQSYVPGKSAKLGETLIVSDTDIKVGDIITYTITYKNSSDVAAEVKITDTLQPGLDFVSAENGGSFENGTVTWTILDVQPGTAGSVSFKAQVNEQALKAVTTNVAKVQVGNSAEVTTNSSDIPVPKTTDMTISKRVRVTDGMTAPADAAFEFTVVLEAGGKALTEAYSYKIDEERVGTIKSGQTLTLKAGDNAVISGLPAGTNYVITENIGKMPENFIALKHTADGILSDKSEENNAVITNLYYDAQEAKFVEDMPQSIVDGKNVSAGQILTYEVKWMNTAVDENGDAKAATVTIEDTIPENTTYVDNSASEGAAATVEEGKTTKLTWNIDAQAGEQGVVFFRVTVNDVEDSATITNKAYVNTVETNTTTNYVPGKSAEEPEESKDDKVRVGEVLTYTITYKNDAEIPAAVTVKDTLETTLKYAAGSAKINGAATSETNFTVTTENGKEVLTWTIPDVPAGATGTVSFEAKATVNALSANITNSASVIVGDNVVVTNEVSFEKAEWSTLTISKVVEGTTEADANEEFEFKLTLKDVNGDDLTGIFQYEINGIQIVLNDEKVIKLQAGQSATLSRLPVGTTYTITEQNLPAGYVQINAENTQGTITNEAKTATFTNRFTPVTLSGAEYLKIAKKIVDVQHGEALWPEGYSFNMQLSAANGTPMPEGSVRGDILTMKVVNVSDENIADFGDIVYTATGTYEYVITEQSGSLLAIDYSQERYRVTVTVGTVGENNTGALKIQSVLTEKIQDADGASITPVEIADHKALFTNGFDYKHAQWKPEVTKVYENTSDPADVLKADEFTFRIEGVEAKETSTGTAIPFPNGLQFATASVKNGEPGADGKAAVDFGSVEFTESHVGNTYTYKITEVNDKNVHDATVYYAEVKVASSRTKNQDENALAVLCTVTYYREADGVRVPLETNETPNFKNIYAPKAAELVIPVQKTLEGRPWLDDETFSFTLKAEHNGTLMPGATHEETLTISKADNGKGSFGAISFTKIGTYVYSVNENVPINVNNGMTYDGHSTTITVTVTDKDAQGNYLDQLAVTALSYDNSTATTDADKQVTGAAAFTNTYKVSGMDFVVFKGNKTLSGKDLETAAPFTFELYEADPQWTIPADAEPKTTTNNKKGEFSFMIVYGEQDLGQTYYYVVKEAKAGQTENGIYHSDVTYQIKVNVEDNYKGGIEAVAEVVSPANTAVDALNFTNEYKITTGADVKLQGTKTLYGRELKDNEFTFELYEADEQFAVSAENALQTTTNKDGKFEFTMNYNEVGKLGTHYYVVREKNTNAVGMNYSKAEYRITVTTEDNKDGTIKVTATAVDKIGTAADLNKLDFTNIYYDVNEAKKVSDGTTRIDGKNVSAGQELNYTIDWTNTAMDDNGNPMEGTVTIVDTIPEYTAYVAGSAEETGGVYDADKNQITWTIDAKPAQMGTVKFKVTVDKDVETGADIVNDKASVNGASTNVTTNYLPGKTAVEEDADGKIQVGDVLTYTITYKNDTNAAATVIVKDTLAEGITFQPGTAKIGDAAADETNFAVSTDANGKVVLTWTIPNVPAGEKGSVSFQAKVNEKALIRKTTNTGTVIVGNNAVTTNEVSFDESETSTLTIRKEVTNAAGVNAPDSEFTFKVNITMKGEALNGDYTYKIGNTSRPIGENGEVTMKAGQSAVIEGLPIGADYTVEEISIPTGFKFEKSENESGKIVKDGNTTVFTNVFAPAILVGSEHLNVEKQIQNVQNGDQSWPANYTFRMKLEAGWGTPMPEGSVTGNLTQTKMITVSKDQKTADFGNIVYTEPGEYNYEISEEKGQLLGINYSQAKYSVNVVVTKADDGALSVSSVMKQITADDGAAAVNPQPVADHTALIINEYNFAHATWTPKVTKEYKNSADASDVLTDGKFSFNLTQADAYVTGNPESKVSFPAGLAATAVNDANGKVDFGTVNFTEAHVGNTYVYKITEAESYVYDATEYYVVVEVRGQATGIGSGQAVTYTENYYRGEGRTDEDKANDLIFRNDYKPAPTEAEINVEKIFSRDAGGWLSTDEFSFTLEAVTANAPMPAENTLTIKGTDAVKKAAFGNISFTTVGTYEYRVTENVPAEDGNGITYDRHAATVTINVTDKDVTGNYVDQLTATVVYDNNADAAVFTNTYAITGTADAVMSGTKTLHGRNLNAGEFTFELYKDGVLRDTKTNDANGAFVFVRTFTANDLGTHNYVVKEKIGTEAGMSYSNTEYHITVTATDNNMGGVNVVTTATVAGETAAADELNFTNFYFDKDAKEVSAEREGKMVIDGMAVSAGEVLTYSIDWLNTAVNAAGNPKAADVTIVDAIPANTKYVEDSASEGAAVTTDEAGNTVLTWTIHAESAQTGTVSFQVKVNEDVQSGGIISNQATIISANEVKTNITQNNVPGKSAAKDGAPLNSSSTIKVGDIITYTINYYNSHDNAADVVITDKLDDALDYIPVAGGPVYDEATRTLTWNVGSVAANTGGTVSFQAKVNENALDGQTGNTANIQVGDDPVVTTNEVILKEAEEGSLTIKKVVTPTEGMKVPENAEFTFNVTLKTGENELKDSYNYKKGDETGTIKSGDTFTLKDGQNLVIEKLPAGTSYTVTEEQMPENFTAVQKTFTGTVTAEETKTFENLYYNVKDAKSAVKAGTTASVDGKSVKHGEILSYEVKWMNTAVDAQGNAKAATVVITDTIPANTTYVEGSASEGAVKTTDEAGNTVLTWTVNAAAGAQGKVSFKVTVNTVSEGGVINNTASVNGVNTNTIHSDVPGKSASAGDGVVTADSKIKVGDTLTYTISYHNSSDQAADVVITDKLHTSLDFVSAANDGGWNKDSRTLTWFIKGVEAGTGGSVSFQAKVNENALTAGPENTATVKVGNNPEVQTNTVTIPNGKSGNLVISKKVTEHAGMADPEKAFTFTVVLKVGGVELIGEYPYTKGETIGTIKSGGTITLLDGESAVITGLPQDADYVVTEAETENYIALMDTFSGKIGEDDSAAAFENIFYNPEEVKDVVMPLSVEDESADERIVSPGDVLKYEISWINEAEYEGKPVKADVIVSDVIPEYTSFYVNPEDAEGSASAGAELVTDEAGNVVGIRWTIKEQEPNARGTVWFKVQVNDVPTAQFDGSINNQAKIRLASSTNPDIEYKEYPTNETENFTPIKKVTYSEGNTLGKPQLNETLTFTISYKNMTSEAVSASITDTLADTLTFISASDNGQYDPNTKTIQWTIGTVPANTQGSVSFTATLNDGALLTATTNTAKVIVGGHEAETNMVTIPQISTGTLTISKNVTVTEGQTTIDTTKAFSFDVTLTDVNRKALANAAYSAVYSDVTAGNSITFDASGKATVTLKHGESVVISGLPEGTNYVVTEKAEAGYTAEEATKTGKFVSTEGTAAMAETAAFENAYTLAPLETDALLGAKKTLTGPEGIVLGEGQFGFGVYTDAECKGTPVTTANNKADGTVTFGKMTFTEARIYNFYIKEVVNPNAAHMNYDGTIYHAVVEIQDDRDGTLSVKSVNYYLGSTLITDESGAATVPTFSNSYKDGYKVASFDVEAKKELTGDRPMSAGEFSFGLYDGETLMATGTNDANGIVAFNDVVVTVIAPEEEVVEESTEEIEETEEAVEGLNVTLPEADEATGVHWYTMKEIIPDDANKIPGVVYDSSEYKVKVTVINDGVNILVADPAECYEADGTTKLENGVLFSNSYEQTPVTNVTINANKLLIGRELENEEFTFTATDKADPAKVIEAKNTADGKISFNLGTFTEDGEYIYTIAETKGTKGGVTYSEETFEVKVVVSDKVTDALTGKETYTGVLTADVIYPDGGVVFTNSYTAAVTDAVTLNASKVLKGRQLKDKEFNFTTTNVADPTNIFTAQNNANGEILFELGTFAKAGTYVYTMAEVPGTEECIDYTTETFQATVTVTDDLNGQLHAAVTYSTDERIFENVYTAAPTEEVTIEAMKKLTGRSLKEGEFTFTATDADGNVFKAVNDADGKIRIELGTFDKAGEYTFKIAEPKGNAAHVTYSKSVFEVTVIVTDDGLGKLKAEVQYPEEEILFHNVYAEPVAPQIPPAAPATGDTQNVLSMMLMCAASISGMAVIVLQKKKYKR